MRQISLKWIQKSAEHQATVRAFKPFCFCWCNCCPLMLALHAPRFPLAVWLFVLLCGFEIYYCHYVSIIKTESPWQQSVHTLHGTLLMISSIPHASQRYKSFFIMLSRFGLVFIAQGFCSTCSVLECVDILRRVNKLNDRFKSLWLRL